VIVAVVAVRMVQVARYQVVDMIAVRNRFMPAACAVDVCLGMPAALVLWRTPRRVRRSNLDATFVDVAVMELMQVPVVQVVDVAAMSDRAVAAVGTVLMRMILVDAMRGHELSFVYRGRLRSAA
jgi:hypothetical protein